MNKNVIITNATRGVIPRVDFGSIKKRILGTRYRLTCTIVPAREIAHLNLVYRNKRKPTDILSFPLSSYEGEIYICPTEVRKKARTRGLSYVTYFTYLFIHGCTHLKGLDHGRTMDVLEARICRIFNIDPFH